ncbi:hypothetical protein PILCRDRAFT_617173 [Piloderma croceum F 1598]|uniref:Uncharacterized protein n=1 Tax=Piloderma croceum (strain F 1598) TaxID=765440 RepID=A0A0C3EYB8_PILCF|nr:hypothetical protein PILCRDRAFT_617173 [Piloderma croceum F 1598]
MRSRPVLLSLPSTVVAFSRSLKLKTRIKALVHHPRCARKSINEQVIPPNTHENLTVEMDGKYDRPVTKEIEPNQQFPTTSDDTSSTPFDLETGQLRSLPELGKPVFGGERTNSAISGLIFRSILVAKSSKDFSTTKLRAWLKPMTHRPPGQSREYNDLEVHPRNYYSLLSAPHPHIASLAR